MDSSASELRRWEARARRGAHRLGLALSRQRGNRWAYGTYAIVDPYRNALLSQGYCLERDDVEEWLDEAGSAEPELSLS